MAHTPPHTQVTSVCPPPSHTQNAARLTVDASVVHGEELVVAARVVEELLRHEQRARRLARAQPVHREVRVDVAVPLQQSIKSINQ